MLTANPYRRRPEISPQRRALDPFADAFPPPRLNQSITAFVRARPGSHRRASLPACHRHRSAAPLFKSPADPKPLMLPVMQALANAARPVSFLAPAGYQTGSCGYCKDPSSTQRRAESSASYYVLTKELDPSHYQELVDRGWRRSGTLLYKPDIRVSCCPHYTIRLPVAEFKPSKDQRQSVNRWNRFVLGEQYLKDAARLHPKSREQKRQQKAEFDLASIHESEYSAIAKPPEPAHRFEVELVADDLTEEKYELFENYQRHVHHETPAQISRTGFKRFLCLSPLKRRTRTLPDGSIQLLGSYHQCYRLDGRLIAMAILDLLPHCVSGVYFIYHSDFEQWSLGKVGAMREAALAKEGGYGYYYMGYYIHSCPKMRYKIDYRPQYVLDLETYGWDKWEDGMGALMNSRSWLSMEKERRRQQRMKKLDQENKDQQHGEQEVKNGLCDGGEALEVRDESDEEEKLPWTTARETASAAESGTSLFDLGIPGFMTPSDIEEQVDLDQITVSLAGGQIMVHTEDLMRWEDGDISDSKSLKGVVAELVAAVGPKVAREMVVTFG